MRPTPSVRLEMALYLALATLAACQTCEVPIPESPEDAHFLQLRRHEPQLQQPSFRPNAQVMATYAGLNFALAQSEDFVAQKIAGQPLIPGNVVSLGLGINLVMGAVWCQNKPQVSFRNGVWTPAGLELDVEIRNLTSKGSLQVTAPSASGELEVTSHGIFRLGLSTAVNASSLHVHVVKLEPIHVDLQPHLKISCVQVDVWNAIPCGIIAALQGDVPGWLTDSLVFLFDSQVKGLLTQIVEFKLNENLRSIPQKFPLGLQNPDLACLQLAFKLLGISHSTLVKAASFQVLATNTCEGGKDFPVPGLVAEDSLNKSMFSLSVGGSVANSVLVALSSIHFLEYAIYPQDLPATSVLGLDTNSLSLAFYCPWLSTKYAFSCPMWRPCNVSATVRAVLPEVELDEEIAVRIPLSVDFHLLNKTNATQGTQGAFLWRVNLTASARLMPSITGTGCDQVLHAELESLKATWIEVTKTQDDSWVATALSINVFLPMLLNGPLLSRINKQLAKGLPLRPLAVGDASYALANSSFLRAPNKLSLTTDVLLSQDCPGQ